MKKSKENMFMIKKRIKIITIHSLIKSVDVINENLDNLDEELAS